MKNIMTVGNLCCGCNNCENVCPEKCIKMIEDKEGFLVPAVDENACIECGMCLRKCPVLNDNRITCEPDVYAVHNKNSETIMKSSSGGIFSLVADEIFSMDGVVWGAVLDEKENEVVFKSAKNISEIAPMRGSKYVQSILNDTFIKIEDDLKKEKRVLFSGTPCQCAALKSYLGVDYDNLYIVDIICHGVPSTGLFKKYMEWLEKKEKSPVTEYKFRTKEYGWGMKLSYKCGEKLKHKNSIFDPYNCNFLNCNIYRESCYKCKYATKERCGDITLGDYWGVLREHPDFYYKDGVSLVLVNSEKGKKLFDGFKDKTDYIQSSFDKAVKHNENLRKPSTRPALRDSIYEGFATNETYIDDKLKVKNSVKKIIKTLIPNDFKMLLRRKNGVKK